MLSTVLRGNRAIQMNIAIIRAFMKLREILSSHKELAFKLKQLETKVEKHDEEIQAIFEAIHRLMAQPEKPKRPMGSEVELQCLVSGNGGSRHAVETLPNSA